MISFLWRICINPKIIVQIVNANPPTQFLIVRWRRHLSRWFRRSSGFRENDERIRLHSRRRRQLGSRMRSTRRSGSLRQSHPLPQMDRRQPRLGTRWTSAAHSSFSFLGMRTHSWGHSHGFVYAVFLAIDNFAFMPKAWIYFSSINGFEKKPQPKRESVYAFSIIFIIYLVTFEVNLYVGFLQNAIWFLSLDVYFVTQCLLYSILDRKETLIVKCFSFISICLWFLRLTGLLKCWQLLLIVFLVI